MNPERLLAEWLLAEADRMAALTTLAAFNLPDAYLAAGFVRNLVWDRLHGYRQTTPLQDLDVVYFDADDCDASRDRALERALSEQWPAPWSVKNQARMHRRNGDAPYRSTADAMSYWVEVETAVGVRLNADGALAFCAPLGLASLLAGELTLNPKRPKPDDFQQRLVGKEWKTRWPGLTIRSFSDK
ncbi:nucleotidyltransferase family protein [Saccharospirillum mangrovi]|uniref:nucleotidyltransferase family protein n=1 Tax=Saccharospirillum mangrovi TaxID=2161747 RepID=UPI000D3AD25C|nr:nucleotidyltransferase family protein [Saccharospirillum mangrovi]